MQSAISTVLLMAAMSGCSRQKDYVETPVYPTRGKLTVSGEPAYGAYLMFYSEGDVGLTKGNKPFARVNQDGTFEVTTYDTGDGAPAGEYRVTVYWPENPDARGPSPDRLQNRYRAPEKSDLRATVIEGDNVLPDWELP